MHAHRHNISINEKRTWKHIFLLKKQTVESAGFPPPCRESARREDGWTGIQSCLLMTFIDILHLHYHEHSIASRPPCVLHSDCLHYTLAWCVIRSVWRVMVSLSSVCVSEEAIQRFAESLDHLNGLKCAWANGHRALMPFTSIFQLHFICLTSVIIKSVSFQKPRAWPSNKQQRQQKTWGGPGSFDQHHWSLGLSKECLKAPL